MSQSISLLQLTVSNLNLVKDLYGELREDHIKHADLDSAEVVSDSIDAIQAELNHIHVNDCFYNKEIIRECLVLANDLLLNFLEVEVE